MTTEISIVTPEQVELKFELAGLGSRFIAMLLDMLVILGIVMLILLAVVVVTGDVSWGAAWLLPVLIIALFSANTGYFLYFESLRSGQSLGKRAVGIVVIMDTGHPLDFRGALLRNLMRAVDSLPVFYVVGAVTLFFSPECKRLGDYVAGTMVVRVPQAMQEQVRIIRQVVKQEALLPALVTDPLARHLTSLLKGGLGALSSEDYRTIRRYLDRKPELDQPVAEAMAARIVELVASKLGVECKAIPDRNEFLSALADEWEQRKLR